MCFVSTIFREVASESITTKEIGDVRELLTVAAEPGEKSTRSHKMNCCTRAIKSIRIASMQKHQIPFRFKTRSIGLICSRRLLFLMNNP